VWNPLPGVLCTLVYNSLQGKAFGVPSAHYFVLKPLFNQQSQIDNDKLYIIRLAAEKAFFPLGETFLDRVPYRTLK
jgi:hypothetical protein